jgi:DNA invertase Pin-like site-specific DNA recombinase
VKWPRVGGFPSGREAQARQRARHLGWAIRQRAHRAEAGSLRNNGTRFGRPRKVDDAEHIATAKRMKADGHTGRDIAKYLGVSRATLYRYLSQDDAA